MRHTLPTLILVPTVCLACGGPGSPPVPMAATPCAVPGVGSPDSLWRQVRASGFTFCVPSDWQPSGRARDSLDAPRWEGTGGSITWALGPPRTMMAPGCRMSVTGRVVTGSNPTPLPPPDRFPSGRSPRSTTTTFIVDSVTLVVTETVCQGTWTTTAWSSAPRMYVQGVAQTATMTELQLLVMQTIRFAAARR